MTRPPRDPGLPVITNRQKIKIGIQGLIITLGPLLVYLLNLQRGVSLEESRTIGFMTLALVQLLHVINVRRKNGLGLDMSIFKNGFLLGAFLLTAGLQLVAVYTPFMQKVLHTVPLSPGMWLWILAGVLGPVLVLQIAAAIGNITKNPSR